MLSFSHPSNHTSMWDAWSLAQGVPLEAASASPSQRGRQGGEVSGSGSGSNEKGRASCRQAAQPGRSRLRHGREHEAVVGEVVHHFLPSFPAVPEEAEVLGQSGAHQHVDDPGGVWDGRQSPSRTKKSVWASQPWDSSRMYLRRTSRQP